MPHASPSVAASRTARVLIITDAVSCRWHYSVGVAQALQPYELELHIAVIGPPPSDAQRSELATLGRGAITHAPTPPGREWTPWGDIAEGNEWLLTLEERIAPDVIHLNHLPLGVLPWSGPTLLTLHGDALSRARSCGEERPAGGDRQREQLLMALRAVDQVIAPTEAVLHDLCASHSSQPTSDNAWEPFRAQPRVIPHARCHRRFAHRPKREFILAAGGLHDASKNMAALDYAARDLPWPVFIAGSEGSAGSNDLMAADCLGALTPPDLANWMGLASIFVLPSRYEASGVAALEAALCGCALVLADLPSLREGWCDAALFVDPARPLEIANALQKLIRNPELRARMGHLARKRALRHSPEQMAERLTECYSEVLSRRGASAAAR